MEDRLRHCKHPFISGIFFFGVCSSVNPCFLVVLIAQAYPWSVKNIFYWICFHNNFILNSAYIDTNSYPRPSIKWVQNWVIIPFLILYPRWEGSIYEWRTFTRAIIRLDSSFPRAPWGSWTNLSLTCLFKLASFHMIICVIWFYIVWTI